MKDIIYPIPLFLLLVLQASSSWKPQFTHFLIIPKRSDWWFGLNKTQIVMAHKKKWLNLLRGHCWRKNYVFFACCIHRTCTVYMTQTCTPWKTLLCINAHAMWESGIPGPSPSSIPDFLCGKGSHAPLLWALMPSSIKQGSSKHQFILPLCSQICQMKFPLC